MSDVLPAHAALPFRVAQLAFGDEPREALVPSAVAAEQQQAFAPFDGEVRADDRVHAMFARGPIKTRRTVHAVAVGQGERGVPLFGRSRDEVLGQAGALEKGERALAAQLDIGRRFHPRSLTDQTISIKARQAHD